MGIFSDNAQAYWNKGLPVIPLAKRNKNPIPHGWSAFHEVMPSHEFQQSWLDSQAEGNIGLVLGAQAGICMLDIDTMDPEVQRIIESVIPKSPWKRVGKKGAVYAYKFTGHKTFRIKGENEGSIVELLSSRTQVVLPPSIHPDTQLPYTCNVPLLSVLKDIPALPKDIEDILRAALQDAGYELSLSGMARISEFISVGARDTRMISHAGILSMAVTRGERTLLDALQAMDHWCTSFVEKVAGDDMDAAKGQERLVQFLIRDVTGDKKRVLPKGWDEGLNEDQKKKLGLNIFNEEYEDWDYERVKEYLLAEFAKHVGLDSPGRARAIEHILARFARSPKPNTMDEDRIINWLVKSAGVNMSVGTLNRRLKELRQGELAGTDHTELAYALKKDTDEAGEIRFDGGKLWQWAGCSWQEKDQNEIMRHIANEYGKYAAGKRLNDHRGILGVFESLCTKPLGVAPIPGINFANGYLTQDLVLLPHDKEYGKTYTLPYRYMPDLVAKAPKWEEFLFSIWGKDKDFADKVQALKEVMCATLFGIGPKFQRAVLLMGLPMCGKSELLKVIKGIMPSVTRCAVPPDMWGDKFMPVALYGKLLNVAGELSENKKIAGDKFKMIIEGNEIQGQYKGKDSFAFSPTCIHWFASNHLPKTADTSNGFNRRWLVFSFENQVAPDKRVLDIGTLIVADEREAIVAWAAGAITELKKKSEFTLPQSHKDKIDDIANFNNTVRFFLRASGRVKMGPDALAISGTGSKTMKPITATLLHDAYQNFCLGSLGVNPVGSRSFNPMMQELTQEFGFQINVTRVGGIEDVSYSNIILVDEKRT